MVPILSRSGQAPSFPLPQSGVGKALGARAPSKLRGRPTCPRRLRGAASRPGVALSTRARMDYSGVDAAVTDP